MNTKSLLFAFCSLLCTAGAALAFGGQLTGTNVSGGVHAFPQTGLIQNVSPGGTHPFWRPGAHYAQRMPVPIFATGTELSAGDCIPITFNIIAHECSRQNNCHGMSLFDVRPAIMRQLAAIPGHNFVTACAGFIDMAWTEYMRQASTIAPGQTHGGRGFPSAFPYAGPEHRPVAQPELILRNPFERHTPLWLEEWMERGGEMQRNHAATQHTANFRPTAMPAHWSDVSLTDRMAVVSAGMQPFPDSAFRTINIETDLERWQREYGEAAAENAALRIIDFCAWCARASRECFNELVTAANRFNSASFDAACERAENLQANQIAQEIQVVADPVCGWVSLPPRNVTVPYDCHGTRVHVDPCEDNILTLLTELGQRDIFWYRLQQCDNFRQGLPCNTRLIFLRQVHANVAAGKDWEHLCGGSGGDRESEIPPRIICDGATLPGHQFGCRMFRIVNSANFTIEYLVYITSGPNRDDRHSFAVNYPEDATAAQRTAARRYARDHGANKICECDARVGLGTPSQRCLYAIQQYIHTHSPLQVPGTDRSTIRGNTLNLLRPFILTIPDCTDMANSGRSITFTAIAEGGRRQGRNQHTFNFFWNGQFLTAAPN